jgi:hypothetical protein
LPAGVHHVFVIRIAILIITHAFVADRHAISQGLGLILILAIHASTIDYRRRACSTLKRARSSTLALAVLITLEVHAIPTAVTLGAGVLSLNNPGVLIARILAEPTHGKRA